MNKSEFLARLTEGRLSRRDFTRVLAGAGLTVAAFSLPRRPAGAAANITYFGWAGYDDPALHPGYVEKHAQEPEYNFFSSEEEGLQKLIGGFEADVLHPCSYNVKRWKDAGVIQPIDTSRLANYADIWDKFKTIPKTVYGEDVYFVPFDCGNASVLYRTDLVDPADATSWDLLFNEKYAGRLAMYDTDTTIIEIAARILGYDNYVALSDEQLAAIKPMIAKQRDILRFYWGDATQIEQALASGEVVAAYAWNDTYKKLKDMGLSVAYMTPKEGMLTWVCGLCLDSRKTEVNAAAYDLIDAMISPEAGAYMLSEVGYGHSNRKAYDLVDPQILADLGWSDPEAVFARTDISDDPEEPYHSKYIDLVNNVKAGLN